MDLETLDLLSFGQRSIVLGLASSYFEIMNVIISFRMPLLFGSISGGRVFAIVFFLSLSLAGLSSLIAIMEFPIHVLNDFGS